MSEVTEIRSTHPYGFRSGQWARILTVAPSAIEGRDAYVIEFADGVTDFWIVDDPSDTREFRSSPSTAERD